MKADRESIYQARPRHCMNVLQGGSSEVLNSVNSRHCSAVDRGLKWLPCAATSAPLLVRGQLSFPLFVKMQKDSFKTKRVAMVGVEIRGVSTEETFF